MPALSAMEFSLPWKEYYKIGHLVENLSCKKKEIKKQLTKLLDYLEQHPEDVSIILDALLNSPLSYSQSARTLGKSKNAWTYRNNQKCHLKSERIEYIHGMSCVIMHILENCIKNPNAWKYHHIIYQGMTQYPSPEIINNITIVNDPHPSLPSISLDGVMRGYYKRAIKNAPAELKATLEQESTEIQQLLT